MTLSQLFDPTSSAYSYVLVDGATREALIIDPVREQVQRDLAVLQSLGAKLVWTVETHVHADHITGAWALAQATGARIAAPAGCKVENTDLQLHDGDTLAFGGQTLRALHTPGHTAGSMCFLFRDADATGARNLFSGDTLLIGGCGRSDFQDGDPGALYDSITQKLFVLPGDTIVWPAHDYHERTQSTVALERASNPRLAGKTRDEFIHLAHNMNLPRPRLIDVALPANRRAGRPEGEDTRQPARATQPTMTNDTASNAASDGITPAESYTGNMTPQAAYEWAQSGRGILIDVRTDAERRWVGTVPGAKAVTWKVWPGMKVNPEFDAQLGAVAKDGCAFLMLCQAGGRAAAAAKRAVELGYDAYRINGGFDGPVDASGQRGHRAGWRAAGLPWKQE